MNTKIKNGILKVITFLVGITLIVSICFIDSDTPIPVIICIICEFWLCAFVYANRNVLCK